ncbi:dCTP deaminase [Micromonospora humi]|uniref:dCTP deaminase n=1 Tax=Micromonospora humi TaxID=745366 RepID=A0A1C5JP30_9ACTN|nr:deoxycytidine triphosphate deaminase [Micromonospora humi]SCG72345.1 dCTP deaminase [Micromonospora humi]
MILTGQEIEQQVAQGRVVIDGFDPARIEPNSYGFRLADTLLRYDDGVLDPAVPPRYERLVMDDGGLVLEPHRFYLGSTLEAMGSEHHAATLYACRSVATLGMWIQFSAPLGHSGAIFPWTLEITVAQRLRVYPGMVVGKIAFWALQGQPHRYAGKYTGSRSVVPSRLAQESVHAGRELVVTGR